MQPGHVYLVRDSDGLCKIGRTTNLSRRLPEIRYEYDCDMTMIIATETTNAPGVEAYWHSHFAEKRVYGEWFDLSDKDIRFFLTMESIARRGPPGCR